MVKAKYLDYLLASGPALAFDILRYIGLSSI